MTAITRWVLQQDVKQGRLRLLAPTLEEGGKRTFHLDYSSYRGNKSLDISTTNPQKELYGHRCWEHPRQLVLFTARSEDTPLTPARGLIIWLSKLKGTQISLEDRDACFSVMGIEETAKLYKKCYGR